MRNIIGVTSSSNKSPISSAEYISYIYILCNLSRECRTWLAPRETKHYFTSSSYVTVIFDHWGMRPVSYCCVYCKSRSAVNKQLHSTNLFATTSIANHSFIIYRPITRTQPSRVLRSQSLVNTILPSRPSTREKNDRFIFLSICSSGSRPTWRKVSKFWYVIESYPHAMIGRLIISLQRAVSRVAGVRPYAVYPCFGGWKTSWFSLVIW